MFDQGQQSSFGTVEFDSSATISKQARADLYGSGDVSGEATVVHYTILANIYTTLNDCVIDIQNTTNTLMKICSEFKQRGKSKLLFIRLRRED